MPGKQYVVLRDFSRTDQKSGNVSSYHENDPYSGPVDDSYLNPQGPDGRGPLLKASDSSDSSSKAAEKSSPASTDSSSKEKS